MNFNELPPSAIPLVLMTLAGPIGAIDVVYYHMWKFRLYAQPQSRGETITHLVRGSTFAVGAYLLATYAPSGAWFWIVATLFLIDFINNVVDASLEFRSRAAFGGLPRTEYIVHIIGSTMAGAVALSFLLTAWPQRSGANELLSNRGVFPDWLILNDQLAAGGAALLTIVELCLFVQALAATHRRPAVA